jgi:hypothetical protein
VLDFVEKPDTAKNLINGGFFVLEPRVFDIISDVTDATVMWEQGPLRKLMEMGELMAYQHDGFWSCCDHLADKRRLEAMWSSGERPWATWADAANADKLIARAAPPGKLKFKSDNPGIGPRQPSRVNGCAIGRSDPRRRARTDGGGRVPMAPDVARLRGSAALARQPRIAYRPRVDGQAAR